MNPVCDVECRDEGMLHELDQWVDAQGGQDVLIVLHSMVDYPLRTQALMAVFAVLSGIAVAAAGAKAESAQRRERSGPGRRRSGQI